MKKLTLKRLDIFTPVSKDQSISNEEFDINNFLHFPILTHDDGSIWKHGSLYLLSKLKNYQKPSPKTLDSIATDLKHFKEYCDNENIDYLIDELIKEITYEFDITTIVITHDMNSVIEIGDTINFIYQGKNWWQGDSKSIIKSDNKEVTDFVFASEFMKTIRENLRNI